MSIAAFSIAEAPIGSQTDISAKVTGPPPKRQVIAKADTVTQPEPR